MKSPINRVKFDPSNQLHRNVFYNFLDSGKWNLHFELQQPWLELPAMCSFMLHMYNFKTENYAKA